MSVEASTYRILPPLSPWLKWSIIGLLFLALLGDFICNEKPIYYKQSNIHHFPIFRDYAAKMGLVQPISFEIDWKNKEYETVLRAPIPYSYYNSDFRNTYNSPFSNQRIKSWRWRHWLGTDQLGRDVLAGLVHGLRIALFIGSCTVLLIALIGIPFGVVCGYFGDNLLRIDCLSFLFISMSILIGAFYTLMAFPAPLETNSLFLEVLLRFTLFLLIVFSFQKIRTLIPLTTKKISIPVDSIGQRIITLLDAIPTLFLILPLMAILKASIWNIIWIVGLLSWTGVARLVRAELLKIRSLPYIESAKAMGLGPFQIIFKHALPNAVQPIIVVLAFSFGSIVMVEAFLTFLGFGMPSGEVTWGSMLNEARSNIRAWWLALFPGLAIFVLVLLSNYFGRHIEKP